MTHTRLLPLTSTVETPKPQTSVPRHMDLDAAAECAWSRAEIEDRIVPNLGLDAGSAEEPS